MLSSAQAQLQQNAVRDPKELINWYYAATFGTGIYTAGDRTVSVLQLPFSRALRTVADDGSGLKFKVSTTLGFYDYSVGTVFNGNIPHRISTLSVLIRSRMGIRAEPALDGAALCRRGRRPRTGGP